MTLPKGTLSIRNFAMPKDCNASGDIFGGWLMAQMDLAGAAVAEERASGRVVTIAVDAMQFHCPVFVGDLLSCFAHIKKIGRTSMTIEIEAWVNRFTDKNKFVKVTEAVFTYVAIDNITRKPRRIDPI